MACKNCTGGSPATPKGRLGVLKDYVVTKLFSKKAPEQLHKQRIAVCASCHEVERDGNGNATRTQLFRTIDGVVYCGRPRVEKVVRWETREGCGCDIVDKARFMDASCPRGRWGPGANFGTASILRILPQPPTLNGIIDVCCRCKNIFGDNGGIGDLFALLPALHGIKNDNPDKLIRLKVKPWRLEWAKPLWPHIAPDDQDLIVGRGEKSVFPTDRYHGDCDIEAASQGLTRHEYYAANMKCSMEPVENIAKTIQIGEPALRWALDVTHAARSEGRKIIMLAPFAALHLRNWDVLQWVKLQQHLSSKGYCVFVMDAPQGEARTKIFNCMRFWGTPPEETYALMKNIDMFIGQDSGLTHIAGIFQVKSIAICGPTVGNVIFDHYGTVRTIQAEGQCSGCWWKINRGMKSHCIAGCELLRYLDAKSIAEAVEETLEMVKT